MNRYNNNTLRKNNTMNNSLKSLFINKNWNPLIDGFKKCKKGLFTRFIFVANSCGFYDTPNKQTLYQIFIKYGALYDIFIVDNKPFANIAFININDAINAYFDLNGKEHQLLKRKLHLDFSEPRYPKVCFVIYYLLFILNLNENSLEIYQIYNLFIISEQSM